MHLLNATLARPTGETGIRRAAVAWDEDMERGLAEWAVLRRFGDVERRDMLY